MGRLIEESKVFEILHTTWTNGIVDYRIVDEIRQRIKLEAPTVEAIPKDNVYKAIQEMMEYEHERSINISLARLNEILEKYGIWGV